MTTTAEQGEHAESSEEGGAGLGDGGHGDEGAGVAGEGRHDEVVGKRDGTVVGVEDASAFERALVLLPNELNEEIHQAARGADG